MFTEHKNTNSTVQTGFHMFAFLCSFVQFYSILQTNHDMQMYEFWDMT